MSVDRYIQLYSPSFRERGVFEREVESNTVVVGNMAHRWSDGEYRWDSPDGSLAGRSRVSIQFVRDHDRWWIVAMTWAAVN